MKLVYTIKKCYIKCIWNEVENINKRMANVYYCFHFSLVTLWRGHPHSHTPTYMAQYAQTENQLKFSGDILIVPSQEFVILQVGSVMTPHPYISTLSYRHTATMPHSFNLLFFYYHNFFLIFLQIYINKNWK